MKLYHGTSAANLAAILREGIKPRGSRKRGNWKDTLPSNSKAVYLTDAYPGHFAAHATKTRIPGVILEVETGKLNPFALHPDEDAMEQVGRGRGGIENPDDGIAGTMVERTKHYRRVARDNPNWEVSLRALGTCGYYGTVPPDAITAYAILEWQKIPPRIAFSLVDTSVAIENYKILKERHRALNVWIMGGEGDVVALDHYHGANTVDMPEDFARQVIESREGLATVLRERAGITVTKLNGKG